MPTFPPYPDLTVSRRRLLAGGLALGAGWLPVEAAAAADCAAPPPLPAGLEPYRRAYRNWSGEIAVDDVWTCAPRTPDDVVALAEWARRHGYRLRPQGLRHGWAPLTVAARAGACPDRTLLVDTTAHLTSMSLVAGAAPAVRVEAGAAMEPLLTYLEGAGYGLVATPAPGDLTVGGVLAIGAHGTAVPAAGEPTAGRAYGSLSNLVTDITAVVGDGGGYRLRTFARGEPDCAALLVHLGRAFVTGATLTVGPDANLRCVSRTDIPAAELFAGPGGPGRTLAGFLDDAGRAEVIWFPFTEKPWLKVWSVAPTRPAPSRPVWTPYNYPFSDNVPEPVARLAGRIVAGEDRLAPVFGQAQYDAAVAGLAATASADIWGASKNLLLYVRPTTLRVHPNGYAVLTRRADVQRVLHEVAGFYGERLAAHADRGRFPVNGALEVRVTGLDVPGPAPGGTTPTLSALCPRADRPEWDVAVWLNVLTLPGTRGANAFFREFERFVFGRFDGSWAAARVEWSKGWGYTDAAAWSDAEAIGRTIPASLPGWAEARATLDRLDPYGVFASPLIG